MGVFDKLLSKEMDRKGFITFIATSLFLLAGGGALAQLIGRLGSEKQSEAQRSATAKTNTYTSNPAKLANSPLNTATVMVAAVSSNDLMLWPSNPTPMTPNVADGKPIEVGLQFTVSAATKVRGIRFYKSLQNTGTHTASLWSATGTRLAQITFTNETASGWQEARFTSPVAIAANKTYVVSYFCSKGNYPADRNYFATAKTSGILTGLATTNGVFTYGSRSSFPRSNYLQTNYWVDVIVENTAPADTTPPNPPVITTAATATSPTPTISGSAEAGSIITLTLNAKTYTTTAVNGLWSITVPPANALNTGQTYTVSVTATDAAANVSTPITQQLTITTALPNPPAEWLTKNGTQLYLGTTIWRGAGLNCHWLGLRESNQQYPSHSMIDEALDGAVAMGATVIRAHTLGISAGLPQQLVTATRADGSLLWNTTAWEPIDYAIAACRTRGIRLLIPFTDQYNYYHKGKQWWVEQAFIHQSSSGIPSTYTYDGTTETGVHSFDAASGSVGGSSRYTVISQQFYRNSWIRTAWLNNYVVEWFKHINQYTQVAYKDEPTIAFAQAGNELWDSGDEWPNHAGADGIAWHAEFSATVKTVAPHVLVVDPKGNGDITHGPGVHDANTDIMDYHLYNANQSYAAGFVTSQANKAAALGKVMVFAEYPIIPSMLATPFAEIETASNVAFDQFWALYITSENHGGTFGEDTAYVVGQDESWRNRYAIHASIMTGTSPPPIPTGPVNLLRSSAAANCNGPVSLYAAGAGDAIAPTLSIEPTAGVNSTSDLGISASGSGHKWVYINDKAAFAPVTPGATYTATASIKLVSGALSQGAYGHITWYDTNGNWLSGNDSAQPFGLASGGTYVQAVCTATAPTNAAYASAQVGFGALTSGTAVLRVDQFGVFAGTAVSPWTSP